ncbi:MAG: hypothetical protein HZB92_06400 [Euryarchaeota archaeon]|nr:hypothetical protein [Euryarchaeota archaeon]
MGLVNKSAMYVAIVGGILLLVAGLTGAAAWAQIRDAVAHYITSDPLVMDIFGWLIIVASFGGFAVILGGLLIGYEHEWGGKFLIMLGAGMGLIGFIIAFATWYLNGMTVMFTIGGSIIGLVGIILSIIARQMAY